MLDLSVNQVVNHEYFSKSEPLSDKLVRSFSKFTFSHSPPCSHIFSDYSVSHHQR
jgi:hypothetical protein